MKKPDKCDSTVLKPEYTFSATSNLVTGKIKMNSTRADTLRYDITYTKIRCGGNTTTYYSSPMSELSAKTLDSFEFTRPVVCSTEFRNSADQILVELTVYLLNAQGEIIETKTDTDVQTYSDLSHTVHNSSTNFVPIFNISF